MQLEDLHRTGDRQKIIVVNLQLLWSKRATAGCSDTMRPERLVSNQTWSKNLLHTVSCHVLRLIEQGIRFASCNPVFCC